MRGIVMVGPFPPPVHGMAVINDRVRQHLAEAGSEPRILNTSANTLNRGIYARMKRIPRIFRAMLILPTLSLSSQPLLYMSLSGGYGQLYELAFITLARIRKMDIFLHHHSYAYLRSWSAPASLIIRIAGRGAMHIVQSPGMAIRIKKLYKTNRVVAVSNIVFHPDLMTEAIVPRRELRTLGFISNICPEKGIFEFLELMGSPEIRQRGIRGLIAGPFQDSKTELAVRSRLRGLSNTKYLGPRYATDKQAFFQDIDALIFPTSYKNETEGIVTHEAMVRGIPVIAYGRGCIPEIIKPGSGKVIHPQDPFVPAALDQIIEWVEAADLYQKASRYAIAAARQTYNASLRAWERLKYEIMDVET